MFFVGLIFISRGRKWIYQWYNHSWKKLFAKEFPEIDLAALDKTVARCYTLRAGVVCWPDPLKEVVCRIVCSFQDEVDATKQVIINENVRKTYQSFLSKTE
jgi:hypothetical protein